MTTSRLGSILVGLALLHALLAGCSAGASKDLPPAERVPSLVVPPDLTVPKAEAELSVPDAAADRGAATYSGYAGKPGASTAPLLAAAGDLRLERSGSQRWLVVTSPAETLWPALKLFLQQNQLALARENPATGILETEWAQGALDRKTLGSGAPGTRDQFRLRLERGTSPGTTEIYLSHRGVVQIGCDKNQLWQLRPPEPETEAEMLRRLMLFLGAQEAQAGVLLGADTGKPRATLVTADRHDNGVVRMSGDMDTAWRRVGLAIEQVGFVVEDRDRSKGLYYVRAGDAVKEATREKKGFFSWFSRGKAVPVGERYQIKLTPQPAGGKEPATDVEVADAAGAVATSTAATRIVELLFEQLK
jgi:outer membrane protein assembly factor BamC